MGSERERRLSIGDGAWIRARRVSPDRAVITDERGRFLLLPAAEIEALAAGDPGGARRKKLADMGFVLASSGEEARAPITANDANVHVLPLRALGDDAQGAVEAIFDSAPRFVHIDLCDVGGGSDEPPDKQSPPADPARIAGLIERARKLSRAGGERLSITLRAPPGAVTPDLAGALARGRVAWRCLLRRVPGPYETERIQNLLGAFSVAGAPSPLSFVTGVIPLDRASHLAGADAIVAACRAAGLVFVELARAAALAMEDRLSDAEHLDLHRAVVRRILDLGSTGAPIVDLGLALCLESLVAAADPSRAPSPPDPRLLVWGEGLSKASPSVDGFATGCAACPYDPLCGTGLLRDPTIAPADRRLGTSFCDASTGLFDLAFGLLSSEDGPRLRTLFRAWMEIHRRVMKHLST